MNETISRNLSDNLRQQQHPFPQWSYPFFHFCLKRYFKHLHRHIRSFNIRNTQFDLNHPDCSPRLHTHPIDINDFDGFSNGFSLEILLQIENDIEETLFNVAWMSQFSKFHNVISSSGTIYNEGGRQSPADDVMECISIKRRKRKMWFLGEIIRLLSAGVHLALILFVYLADCEEI